MTAYAAKLSINVISLGIRANFTPLGAEVSKECILLAQGDQQDRADTGYIYCGETYRIFQSRCWHRYDVGNVDVALAIHQPRIHASFCTVRLTNQRCVLRGVVMGRDSAKLLSLVDRQTTQIRAADSMRLLQDCVEYRREVTGRGIDDAKDVRESSLLSLELVALGPCLSELPLKVGYILLKIG